MFAVLLAATTLGDPNTNPILYDRLMGRFVAAVRAAADRHPAHAVTLRTQAKFIQLDAEVRRVGAISREEESAFELNLIQSYMQVMHTADGLADPVLDLELMATLPPLSWAMVTRPWWAGRRSGCSLQGLAMWHLYRPEAQPAVARVVGYSAILASCRLH